MTSTVMTGNSLVFALFCSVFLNTGLIVPLSAEAHDFCIKEKKASPSQLAHSSLVITSVANVAL